MIENDFIKPADGYDWLYPDDSKDLRVEKIKIGTLESYVLSHLKVKYYNNSYFNKSKGKFTGSTTYHKIKQGETLEFIAESYDI